jgi:lipopolysaccharide biosynthesis glycosyltransferase
MGFTAAVAYCSDATMEVPLHASAYSVLKNIDDEWTVKFYLMVDGIDIHHLRRTLDPINRPYQIIVLPKPSSEDFKDRKPFFGSLAAYYRVALPNLISDDRFLYLDTDIVVETDISTLFTLDMESKPVGFVTDGTASQALEAKFFETLGIESDRGVFNSGVMLVDVKSWKQQDCFEHLMDFWDKYPNVHDQPALNVLFSNNHRSLDRRYNICLSMISREQEVSTGIFHFVGSPKPWDLFGFYHPYYDLWARSVRPVHLPFWRKFPPANINNWMRLPRLAGGYWRVLRRRRSLKQAKMQQ